MRGVTEMEIQESGEELFIITDKSHWLNDSEQRELLLWFKEHRPMMWRDIFCDDCPEVQ
jgi:hypothetical protein